MQAKIKRKKLLTVQKKMKLKIQILQNHKMNKIQI